MKDSINVLALKTVKIERFYDETNPETYINDVISHSERELTNYQSSTTKRVGEYTATEIKIENNHEVVETESENEQFQNVIEATDNTFNDNSAPNSSVQSILNSVIGRDVSKTPLEFDTPGKTLLICTWANCNKGFRHLRSLKYHIRTHKNEKPFKCSTCERCFRGKETLIKHAVIHDLHPRTKYACTFENCNTEFLRLSSLKYHLLFHKNQKPFKCSLCDTSFRAKHILKNHMWRRHNTQQSVFNCHRCSAVFKTELLLSKHLRNQHEEPVQLESSKSETSRKSLLACTWENCNKVFTELKGLNIHITVHKNEKPFKCSTCNRCFRSKDNMTQHAALHGNRKKFQCQVCNKKYLNKSSLTMHMRLHTGKCLHKCSKCGREFTEERTLTNHMKTHSKEKVEPPINTRFVCTWANCSKKFNAYGKLQYHLLVHNNGKPFNCTLCDKSFRTKCNLNQHMLRIHNVQRTVFKCHRCSAVFETKLSLSNHLSHHEESVQSYECHQCTSVFSTKRSLSNHSRLHKKTLKVPKTIKSESKTPYEYEYKTYSRSHAVEKAYECSQCNKKYSDKHSLDKHYQIYTQHKIIKIEEPSSTSISHCYGENCDSICKEELILDEDL